MGQGQNKPGPLQTIGPRTEERIASMQALGMNAEALDLLGEMRSGLAGWAGRRGSPD